MLEGTWMAVRPTDYLVEYERDPSVCQLLLTEADDDILRLGRPFLKGFYSTYSYEHRTVTLAAQDSSLVIN